MSSVSIVSEDLVSAYSANYQEISRIKTRIGNLQNYDKQIVPLISHKISSVESTLSRLEEQITEFTGLIESSRKNRATLSPKKFSLLNEKQQLLEGKDFTDIVKKLHHLGISILSEEEVTELSSFDEIAKKILDQPTPIKLISRIMVSVYQYEKTTECLKPRLKELLAKQKQLEETIQMQAERALTQWASRSPAAISDDLSS